MDRMQLPPANAVIDRRGAQTEPEQLLAGDDAALARRQFGNPVIDGGITAHMAV
jgi:hypothetical protein